MSKVVFILIFSIISRIAFSYSGTGSGEAHPLKLFLVGENAEKIEQAEADFSTFLHGLKNKKGNQKNDISFLKKLFYKAHKDFLRSYENYVVVDDLFTRGGKYDCLTGTALYALILDQIGIDYSIKETDFHVYLIAHLDGKDVLLESTDPVEGFIVNGEEILYRKKIYRLPADQVENFHDRSEVDTYARVMSIDRTISLLQLAGLQYYNMAVKYFNAGNYEDAAKALEVAASMYNSKRIRGLQEIIQLQASDKISMRQ